MIVRAITAIKEKIAGFAFKTPFKSFKDKEKIHNDGRVSIIRTPL